MFSLIFHEHFRQSLEDDLMTRVPLFPRWVWELYKRQIRDQLHQKLPSKVILRISKIFDVTFLFACQFRMYMLALIHVIRYSIE